MAAQWQQLLFVEGMKRHDGWNECSPNVDNLLNKINADLSDGGSVPGCLLLNTGAFGSEIRYDVINILLSDLHLQWLQVQNAKSKGIVYEFKLSGLVPPEKSLWQNCLAPEDLASAEEEEEEEKPGAEAGVKGKPAAAPRKRPASASLKTRSNKKPKDVEPPDATRVE